MTAIALPIAVVTTVGDKKEARRLAHALVEGGLAPWIEDSLSS